MVLTPQRDLCLFPSYLSFIGELWEFFSDFFFLKVVIILFNFFIFIYLFQVYGLLPTCMISGLYIYTVTTEAREGIRSLGTEVVGGCKLPWDAENQTSVFHKNSPCSEPLGHFSSPMIILHALLFFFT